MVLECLPWGGARPTLCEKKSEQRERSLIGLSASISFLQTAKEERLAICVEEGVAVVSFFWGQAGPLISQAHRGEAKVLHTVASSQEARVAVSHGADVIVAQGWEAGGHVYGTVATMALVPAVVNSVAPVPVIAAGGIADGRGLAAAMALGASGAWIGTRFLASEEAAIHPRYRELLFEASESDTHYGTLFDVGWPDVPHRTLRNKTVEDWEAAGRPPTGVRPREGEVHARSPQGDVVAYQSDTPGRDYVGDIDALSLWSGQGVGLGPVEIHLEFMTAAARWMMASKLWSVLSARMAMRLNSLSLQKKFSIR